MARRISEDASRQIDRDYPHQVALAIPRDGLARGAIGWMDRWCLESCRNRFAVPSSLSGEDTHHHLRWCFVDRADADAFQGQFGGERMTVAPGAN
jgi:hypothetical protein